MNKMKLRIKEPRCQLFLFAVVLRIAFFIVDLLVGSLYVDEAMTTLNAFEIAKNGTDLFGDKMPLYFDTWLIGGQSPVATYFSALSVFVFGQTKFAVRFPVLITNIASLWAFFSFADEVFKEKRERIAFYAISAAAPWFVFSNALLLDCNYCAFFIAFAICFLAKAVNRNATVYYIVSMVFFGMCLYTYMAAAIFIPVLLVTTYLSLMFYKKINAKNVILSVITVLIVSVPFIILGLVTIGVLPKTNVLCFSINNMDYYSRQSSMSVFNRENPIVNAFFASCLLMLDIASPIYEGINKFQFSILFGGVFVIFGIIKFSIKVFKKKQENVLLKSFFFSFLSSGLLYVFSVGEVGATFNMYRYAPLEYTTLLFEGLGIIYAYDIIKKKLNPKAKELLLTAYILLSVAAFGCVYGMAYLPQVNS
ncbi:MAG: glycosyltransferase family 39 protein, partial [Eubacterium sp.]|nr:glycosyltransferase family 39 protein [Eubacterium sp.]